MLLESFEDGLVQLPYPVANGQSPTLSVPKVTKDS